MGIEENRHAREVRLRLLMPPNAVPDSGIDLKRRQLPQQQESPPEPEPAPPEISPPASNVLLFTPRTLTVMRVIELVAKHSGFVASEILGGNRKTNLVFARHVAFWLCIKHFPKRSLPQMGMVFNKDHTSIIHGRDRIRRYVDSNSPEGVRVRNIIKLVEDEINDCSGPAIPAVHEFDLEVREEASVQEQKICPVGERSLGAMATSEKKPGSPCDGSGV